MSRQKIETFVALAVVAVIGLLAVAATVNSYRDRHHAKPIAAAVDPAAPAPEATPATKPNDSPAPTPPSAPSKPRVALLTAKSCGPCRRFERNVLPDLSDLAIVSVDVDTQKDLATTLVGSSSFCLPEVCVYLENSSGEHTPLALLAGYHSAQEIRDFLDRAERGKPNLPSKAADVTNDIPPCCAPIDGQLQSAEACTDLVRVLPRGQGRADRRRSARFFIHKRRECK
jgi:hypothetical protein